MSEDIYNTVRQLGIKILEQRWPLVTAGEWDAAAREIRVNLKAVEAAKGFDRELVKRAIVAHELRHALGGDEAAAAEFVVKTCGDSKLPARLTELWRKSF
jgi:hypothetical protein